MVKFILFEDPLRKEEIERFYTACQMHRDYYRSRPKAYHPLTYFREGKFPYQCPLDMTSVYLSYPDFYVKYKQPVVLAQELGRTSHFPPLPGRMLAPKYNKSPCQVFSR